MGINFPSSPADGLVFNAAPGVSFVAKSGLWRPALLKTALPKNYVVNPTMTVSQENGDTGSASGPTLQYYAADQWWSSLAMASGAFSSFRGRPAPGGTDAVGLTVTTTVPAPTAGVYMQLIQVLEGQRVADFQWGTAAAKQAIFRFDFYATVAGTYSVQIKNSDGSRTFLAPITVAASTWTTFSIVVPGDTAGTWAKDNTFGIQVGLGLSSGTTYGGGVAGWQAGNKVQIAGNTNGAGTAGTFYLANVGFYLDPYLTGVAPPFAAPDFAQEMRRCQRYWYKGFGFGGITVSATSMQRGGMRHPVPMRTTPAGAIKGAPKLYDAGVTPAVTAIASTCNQYAADFDFTAAAGGLTGGRAGQMWYQGDDNSYIAMSARM